MVLSSDSRCSGGLPIVLRWHESPAADEDATVNELVALLMSAIDGPDRMKDPYRSADAKKGFERYIRRAMQGKLQPVDEVKYIERSGPDAPLYEIRWDDVKVVERRRVGPPALLTSCVRLYHAEPLRLPRSVVALHGHEKLTSGSKVEIRDHQNREIDCALVEYMHLEAQEWSGF